ncbi:MAG: hypothetical protein R3C97_19445 [Geminicoccaceae bacterium]
MNHSLKTVFAALFLVAMAGGLSSCGDTWEGIKQDTSDITKSTGETIEKAGEKVQESAQ